MEDKLEGRVRATPGQPPDAVSPDAVSPDALPLDGLPPDGLPLEAGQVGLAVRGLELLQTGGPVVAVLLLLSVAALAIGLAKLWQFHRARLGARRVLRDGLALCRQGRDGEALTLLAASANPAAQALARALRGRRRGLPEERVREEVYRYAAGALEALRGWLRPLEVIAALAPLLGLFGTVLGMIAAFRQLETAGSRVDPAVLSGGIWEALLTTAVGLAVAMPAVALLNWLERRVERLAHEIDDAVTRLFAPDLSADLDDEIRPHRHPHAARPHVALAPASE